MITRHASRLVSLIAAFALLGGCRTTRMGDDMPPDYDMRDPMARAQALFDQGRYTQAMHACIDATQQYADTSPPGLGQLQQDIAKALWDERARQAAIRQDALEERMQIDAEMQKSLPDTYRLNRRVTGDTSSLRSQPSAMQRALERPVTVHLDGVSLPEFILAIGNDENINMISDDFGGEQTMTLHADEVPLREILDYVSRNMGVTFSVGSNMIWVTPQESADATIPMETRIYRLRKGLSNEELAGGPESIAIIEAITRFVPEVEGGDLFFSGKAHTLIAKNTRANLARIEEIIDALDVSPPQVLIEARFISTSVTDLSELGIDWVMNGDYAVTRKNVVIDGKAVNADSTIVSDASVGFTSFPGEATGLNFTYSGILTDPMFDAVVHALQTSGKSRTLSVPKVTTVNNRPASIRIGEDFRYFEEYDVEEIPSRVSDNGSTTYRSILVPVGTPALEELGIELNVTPSVGADLASISLYLIPEISTFVRYESYNVAGGSNNSNNNGNTTTTNDQSLVRIPIFKRSRIETEVVVHSGETVVMGGLIASTQTDDEDRVPFLSSIPLIGRLFRHDTKSMQEANLLIFVTASILSERGENLIPIVPGAPEAGEVQLQ